ncbi:hypothetical protein Cni_G06044 [Canna indica]|uniref:DNA/RNA-binding protein Kin17 WH-like domain-containing protein n=1 Tax=Canna indica TaxID=4628 RepID=A0AAQ3JW87_9LILI|nr:hypothetical protein Cni_G06044 [Canna indica]
MLDKILTWVCYNAASCKPVQNSCYCLLPRDQHTCLQGTTTQAIAMGKNEFLTPKAIANRIKAKGLQKLRWYCQMCQKQCRDENGFKCHCLSESHQRQMQVFGQNPSRIVEGYSEEFERTFLDLVRRSHCFCRVAATIVYNEYINDRHHIHMNSTRWATLTEFVKHLGRAGHCKAEDIP